MLSPGGVCTGFIKHNVSIYQFWEANSPTKHSIDILISNSKEYVDDFVGEFLKPIDN